jgi:hypothetical protein
MPPRASGHPHREASSVFADEDFEAWTPGLWPGSSGSNSDMKGLVRDSDLCGTKAVSNRVRSRTKDQAT